MFSGAIEDGTRQQESAAKIWKTRNIQSLIPHGARTSCENYPISGRAQNYMAAQRKQFQQIKARMTDLFDRIAEALTTKRTVGDHVAARRTPGTPRRTPHGDRRKRRR